MSTAIRVDTAQRALAVHRTSQRTGASVDFARRLAQAIDGASLVARRTSGRSVPRAGSVRTAIDAILEQQEPFPAVVMHRRWDILLTNAAARRFFGWLLEGSDDPAPTNVLRMMFDPRWIRPYVSNWDAVAETLLRRVHREAVGGIFDDGVAAILGEILRHPGVPRRCHTPDLITPLVPVIRVRFAMGDCAFNFFSTVTVIGTAQDVTLQDVRIECSFPADAPTAEASRQLARLSD